jgi:hypothetical protein
MVPTIKTIETANWNTTNTLLNPPLLLPSFNLPFNISIGLNA